MYNFIELAVEIIKISSDSVLIHETLNMVIGIFESLYYLNKEQDFLYHINCYEQLEKTLNFKEIQIYDYKNKELKDIVDYLETNELKLINSPISLEEAKILNNYKNILESLSIYFTINPVQNNSQVNIETIGIWLSFLENALNI